MPVAEEHDPAEGGDSRNGVLGHRTSRRQVLKGAALTGAGVVWAVPVVESLMMRTAAAASAPPQSSTSTTSQTTFPSWAYVLYTTATSGSAISSSNLFVAGYQSSNGGLTVDQAFAANPHGSLTSPSESILGETIVMAIEDDTSVPVPVTAAVDGGSPITATPEYNQTSVTQVGNTISPTAGVTILGAFYFGKNSLGFQPVSSDGSVTLPQA